MPRWPNMARNGSRHSSVIMKVLCPTPIPKASYCPGLINCSNRPLYGSGFRGDNVLPSMIFLFLIVAPAMAIDTVPSGRSEEHTSELQSLMRISYAVFCLKKQKIISYTEQNHKSHQSTS